MKETLIDIETYSEVDIKTCGLYRYATDPSFEILLIAWATDDGSGFGETQCCDLATGDPFPTELLEAFQSGSVRLIAHNASFERVCFSVHLQRHFPGQYLQPGAFLSPDNWLCTMVMAGSLTLPMALKDVGAVLKTAQQKDKEGERLIKLFSMPCKPTKSNGYRRRNLPQHYPADWAKFKGYCIQDVNTEIDIYKRLKRFPMPDREWHHYRVNERVNDRGVKIDTELVQQAIACDLMLSDAMTKKAYELTGLENPNSVSQLKSWLDERGIPMDSLGKKDVAQMIGELDKNGVDEEAMDMLKLRLQMAKSSVKKYQAAERCVCMDGRARGLFQFYGASRTGRYSGRNIQLQNLPQNHISTLEQARDLVKMGCFDMVESIYGNTPDVLSQLIRTMLVPKEGCEFIVADFSAIEARVLAWEAEEQWVLDAFENGEDLYCATASQMFHVPVVKHGVNGELRQKGKIATLACIAEGSLVLTDKGLIPIESVTRSHKLWDGSEWVEHDGIVYKGEKEVIEYDGLVATPDHLVWIEGKSEPVYFGVAAACGAHLVQTGDGRRAIRMGKDYQPGKEMEQNLESLLCPDRVCQLWSGSMDDSWKPHERDIARVSIMFAAEADTTMARQETYSGKATVREPQGPTVYKLRCARGEIQFLWSDGSRVVSDRDIRAAEKRTGDRSDRYKWGLCERKYSVCNSQRECWEQKNHCPIPLRPGVLAICSIGGDQKTVFWLNSRADYPGRRNGGIREKEELAVYRGKVRVYDIRNAGRRHRFTVSGKLVHNCGYGGSSGALISMGALQMGLKEEELPEIIDSWREANPKIVQYWWDVEKAAMTAYKTGERSEIGKIAFEFWSGTLWMVLPSGRRLAYIKPRTQPNRFGRMSLTYEGVGQNHKWSRQETYSGRLVENATQAIARDILAEAMARMEDYGLNIVAHVHDEVIIEAPAGKYTVDEVCKLMAVKPDWCEGLPLSAAGYLAPSYYFKD